MTQVIIQNKKGLGVVRESNDHQYTRDAHLHQNTAGDTAYIFCSHINVTTTGKYDSTERVFMQCFLLSLLETTTYIGVALFNTSCMKALSVHITSSVQAIPCSAMHNLLVR